MSGVAKGLAFASTSVTPAEVVEVWPVWQGLHPELRVVEADDLRMWLNRVPAEESDPVLQVLARRASGDGLNDWTARRALVWMLLPGAIRVASRYWWSPGIDFIVAKQLWIWVSAFPWQTTCKVAGNLMGRLAHEVRREIGKSSRPDPNERLNASSVQYLDALELPVPNDPSPAKELGELLDHAVETEAISPWRRWFLLVVVETAWDFEDEVGVPAGLGGLGSPALCARVGERIGLSARTVRRRLQETVHALRRSLPGLVDDLREAA